MNSAQGNVGVKGLVIPHEGGMGFAGGSGSVGPEEERLLILEFLKSCLSPLVKPITSSHRQSRP